MPPAKSTGDEPSTINTSACKSDFSFAPGKLRDGVSGGDSEYREQNGEHQTADAPFAKIFHHERAGNLLAGKIQRVAGANAMSQNQFAVKNKRNHRRNGNVACQKRDDFVQSQPMRERDGGNHLKPPNWRDAAK